MKSGDLVTVLGTPAGDISAALLNKWVGCDEWWTVMTFAGIFNWPETRMEKIND
jgi:hypothetical protein